MDMLIALTYLLTYLPVLRTARIASIPMLYSDVYGALTLALTCLKHHLDQAESLCQELSRSAVWPTVRNISPNVYKILCVLLY